MLEQKEGLTEAERRARKRVEDVRAFYDHVFVYLLATTVMVVVDLVDGTTGENSFIGLDWAYFPLIGWGIFVLVHGLTTFGVGRRFFGADWEERKLAQYVEEEKRTPPVTTLEDDTWWDTKVGI